MFFPATVAELGPAKVARGAVGPLWLALRTAVRLAGCLEVRAGGCVSDPYHRWRHVRQTAQVATGAAVVAPLLASLRCGPVASWPELEMWVQARGYVGSNV